MNPVTSQASFIRKLVKNSDPNLRISEDAVLKIQEEGVGFVEIIIESARALEKSGLNRDRLTTDIIREACVSGMVPHELVARADNALSMYTKKSKKYKGGNNRREVLADLTLSVNRVQTRFQKIQKEEFTSTAYVYLTGLLEASCQQLIDRCAVILENFGRGRVTITESDIFSILKVFEYC